MKKTNAKNLQTVNIPQKILLLLGACACMALLFSLYWLFLYPYRILGAEGDARHYQNHAASQLTGREESPVVFDNFVFITVNGVSYRCNPSANDRRKYKLSPQYYSEKKKTIIDKKIKEPEPGKFYFLRKDIGKKMGPVEKSNYKLLEGLETYHYAPFPENDDICLLKLEDGYGYQFFIKVSP